METTETELVTDLNEELRKFIAAINGHELIASHAKHLKIYNTDDFRF